MDTKTKQFLICAIQLLQRNKFISKDVALIHSLKPTYKVVLEKIGRENVVAQKSDEDVIQRLIEWVQANNKSTFMHKVRGYLLDNGPLTESKAAVLAATIPAYFKFLDINARQDIMEYCASNNKWIGTKHASINLVGSVIFIEEMRQHLVPVRATEKRVTLETNGDIVTFNTLYPIKYTVGSNIRVSGNVLDHGKSGEVLFTRLKNAKRLKM